MTDLVDHQKKNKFWEVGNISKKECTLISLPRLFRSACLKLPMHELFLEHKMQMQKHNIFEISCITHQGQCVFFFYNIHRNVISLMALIQSQKIDFIYFSLV